MSQMGNICTQKFPNFVEKASFSARLFVKSLSGQKNIALLFYLIRKREKECVCCVCVCVYERERKREREEGEGVTISVNQNCQR